jgi:hypothetical protein
MDANVIQHAIIQGFKALLHPAAMGIHANIANKVVDAAHQVEAGTIAHFNCAVCDYDDHCLYSFKRHAERDAPSVLPQSSMSELLHRIQFGEAVYGTGVIRHQMPKSIPDMQGLHSLVYGLLNLDLIV